MKTTEPTVTQQIFLVSSSEETPNSIDISLKTETTPIKLGSLDVDQPLFDHKSKLINIPMALGKAGQSLVYALGPSECESIAFGIADFDGYECSDEQRELSVLAKETVHPKFQLSQSVLQGVGYHYGRLLLTPKSSRGRFLTGPYRLSCDNKHITSRRKFTC